MAKERCASKPSSEWSMAMNPARKLVYSKASKPDCSWPDFHFLSGGDWAVGCRKMCPAEGRVCSEGLGQQSRGASGDLAEGQNGGPQE